jgi:hypothetical protein
MIDYTAHVSRLVRDVAARVPCLGFIDPEGIVVFARAGRSAKAGPLATCHAVNQPPSAPTFYWWRDRRGCMVRRSDWFIVKSPVVSVGGRRIDFLISVSLPRFCDQTLERSRKQALYAHRVAADPRLAKLDTIIHELYHIAPDRSGIRRCRRADGRDSAHAHSPAFYRRVAALVEEYLATGPDPALLDFLRHGSRDLVRRHGEVTATTFVSFPSFPQPYPEPLAQQPLPMDDDGRVEIVPLAPPPRRREYTDRHLETRRFLPACAASRGAATSRGARSTAEGMRGAVSPPGGAPVQRDVSRSRRAPR